MIMLSVHERIGEENDQSINRISMIPLTQKLKGYQLLIKEEEFDKFLSISEDPQEVEELASLIKDLDQKLTGRTLHQNFYTEYALSFLTEGEALIYLADDGYSRLTLSLHADHPLRIDRGLSTDRVIKKWNALKCPTNNTSS